MKRTVAKMRPTGWVKVANKLNNHFLGLGRSMHRGNGTSKNTIKCHGLRIQKHCHKNYRGDRDQFNMNFEIHMWNVILKTTRSTELTFHYNISRWSNHSSWLWCSFLHSNSRSRENYCFGNYPAQKLSNSIAIFWSAHSVNQW